MSTQINKLIPELFVITAKTNLHAGSGSTNNGMIDNMIQRDHSTRLPCINSSSLKGALREFFKEKAEVPKEIIHFIFGHDPEASKEDSAEDNEKNKNFKQGAYRFFQADLLSIPKPGEDVAYKIVSSKFSQEHFINTLDFFDSNCQESWKELSGEEHQFSDVKDFIELTDDFNLPVIARNYLENGESKNLWYEQVLPRETRLFFIILRPEIDAHFNDFKSQIEKSIVQIGANATIGYGYCKIKHFELKKIVKP